MDRNAKGTAAHDGPTVRISDVRHVADKTFRVKWAGGKRDGLTDEVDLSEHIGTYKAFSRLRGAGDLLGTVEVRHGGTAIGWGNDDSVEMSAETVEGIRLAAARRVAIAAALVPQH